MREGRKGDASRLGHAKVLLRFGDAGELRQALPGLAPSSAARPAVPGEEIAGFLQV